MEGKPEESSQTAILKRCCECSFWAKYFLFTINFIVWVAGGVMVGVGIWARTQKGKVLTFDNLMTDPAFLLIGVGSVMFIISVFGCTGALRENTCLLKVFIACVAVVFLVEVVAGILAFTLSDDLERSLLGYMKHAIEHYEDNIDIKDSVDFVQEQFGCCGAASYRDWDVNVAFNCSSSAPSRCGVPMSCCVVQNSVRCGFQVRRYSDEFLPAFIHTAGCINILMTTFKDNLFIIGLVAFSVGLLELFAMLLANQMIRYIVVAKKTR